MQSNQRTLIANIWQCPDGTTLRTRYGWDYVSHTDKDGSYWFLDGGIGRYFRLSPGMTDLCVYSDDPIEKIREVFEWRSYGKNNEYAPEGVVLLLKSLTSEHIHAILQTQRHIKGTYVEDVFKRELEYREQKGLV